MHLRLGDILAEQGFLNEGQIERILQQQKRGGEPFGVLCERLYDIPPETIEQAWVTQYISITRRVDPRTETYHEAALDLVSRRQAWQFRVLPIRFDGEELMVATTGKHLRRALRFVTKFIGVPVYLVIAEPAAMGEVLCKRYPLAGMTPKSIDDDALDRLLALAKSGAG